MKKLKRILCLFLATALLSSEVFAVPTPGTGANIVRPDDGGNTGFSTKWTGLAIGLQHMSGMEYTITLADASEVEESGGLTPGLANVVKHFTYTYPNPYANPETGQSLLYILPNTGTTPKYRTGVSPGGNISQVPEITYLYCNPGALYMTHADKLFEMACNNAHDGNPTH